MRTLLALLVVSSAACSDSGYGTGPGRYPPEPLSDRLKFEGMVMDVNGVPLEATILLCSSDDLDCEGRFLLHSIAYADATGWYEGGYYGCSSVGWLKAEARGYARSDKVDVACRPGFHVDVRRVDFVLEPEAP